MKSLPLWLCLTSLVCAGAEISANFEGGSIGRVEKVSDSHFRVAVKGESDENGRNRQANWYYFRVDDAPETVLTIDMDHLPGEYNFKPNRGAVTKDTPPFISYDGKQWTPVEDVEYDSSEPKLRLRIKPEARRIWIAHTPPYTNEHLAKLRKHVLKNPSVKESTIGRTVGGREMYVWTFAPNEANPRKTIWLMFRQHSWESGSSWVGEGAVRELLANGKLRDGVQWKIFPLCDPDGVARGGVRFNANGFDLNRNWDTLDPKLMPEIFAQRKAVADFISSGGRVDLFLTLHNTETAEYLDGPPDPSARELGEKLFETLKRETTFHPSRRLAFAGVTTTAGMKGRMTVVQGLSHDFKIPAFLMEQRVSFNSKLGSLPRIDDRLEFGRQLVRALAEAVK